MRTITIMLGGLVLLGIFVAIGWRFGGVASMVLATQLFIPVWTVAAISNMWIGVSRAGYSIAEEFPIFIAVLAIPAAVAGFVWWRFA